MSRSLRNKNYIQQFSLFFISFGNRKNDAYSVSDRAKAFIPERDSLFTQNSKDNVLGFVDTKFSLAAFAKNPNNHGDHLFKVQGLTVFQVFEDDDFRGRPRTFSLAHDSKGNVYSGTLLGHSEKVIDGKRITLYRFAAVGVSRQRNPNIHQYTPPSVRFI